MVITAYATIETAVEAMRRGAFDYLPKPFTPNQLRLVKKAIVKIAVPNASVTIRRHQVRDCRAATLNSRSMIDKNCKLERVSSVEGKVSRAESAE